MTIYDKLIAAEDYSKAIKYLVIALGAQFEKCKAISKNGFKIRCAQLLNIETFRLR